MTLDGVKSAFGAFWEGCLKPWTQNTPNCEEKLAELDNYGELGNILRSFSGICRRMYREPEFEEAQKFFTEHFKQFRKVVACDDPGELYSVYKEYMDWANEAYQKAENNFYQDFILLMSSLMGDYVDGKPV